MNLSVARKLGTPLLIGCWVCFWLLSSASAQEVPTQEDWKSLVRRLEAAEQRIRDLEGEAPPGKAKPAQKVAPAQHEAEGAPAGKVKPAQYQYQRGGPLPPVSALPPLPPVSSGDDSDLPELQPLSTDPQPLSELAEQSPLDQRLSEMEQEWKAFLSKQTEKEIQTGLKPTVQWSFEMQMDTAWFSQSELNRETVGNMKDGMDFRRLRLEPKGTLYKDINYKLGLDFAAGGRPSFTDNLIEFTHVPILGNVRVGHFFVPFGLERNTTNRYTVFMERSLPDLFTPQRRLGFAAHDHTDDERATWIVGAFKSGNDNFGDDVADLNGWMGSVRGTWLPMYEAEGRRLIHLGAAYTYGGAKDRQVRFRSTPEIRMGTFNEGAPYFINTGFIDADRYQLIGAEMALVYGSFYMQSEIMYVPVDQINGPNLAFQGYYVYASYYLTGENRRYQTDVGLFDRTIPNTNVYGGLVPGDKPKGIGAWEVAARWSQANLNSNNIQGGRLTDITIGLNWYLNPYTRITWNYIHPMLVNPVTGFSTADVYAMRFQLDF